MTASPRRPSAHDATTHDAIKVPVTGPKYGAGIAAAVYALATLALGWPALIGKFLVNPRSDQYIAGYAFREFAASTLRATGHFPLWNPYQFGGMPFVAAMHGDIFYPTFLLRMFLPTDVAMTWGFIVHVFLAGFLAFLFLRQAGFRFGGALVGGLAYMLSGHIATFVSPGHDGKLFVTALFPLLLWTVVAWVRDGRRWALGALALVVGLDILSPHPQLLQYSLLAAGAYAIVLAVGLTRDGKASGRDAFIRLAAALGAVVVGLLIGAVQFLPVREYVSWSPRAAGIGTYDRATSFAKNPQEILNAYLPEFTGILDAYWGPNGIHFQGDYAGAVALILAGAGLVGFRNDPRKRILWFWLGATIVALLWSLGAHTPFYLIPYYLVPGTKYFRAPDTFFFIGTFGMAVFVARGVERAIAGEVGKKYAIGWLIFAAAIALFASSGVLTAFARSIAPEQRLDAVDANSAALVMGAFRSFLFITVTVAFFLGLRERWGSIFRAAPLAWLAFLCAADLYWIDRMYWIFSPPAAELYAATPATNFLAHLPQPARVLAMQLNGEGGSPAKYDGSGLMVHRVLNTFGYHGNEIGRYNDLVGIQQGSGPSIESFKTVIGNPNVSRLTATQYVLTNSLQLPNVLPGVTKVFGPDTDDATGETDYVFRLPVTTPFAWVAPVIVKAADDAVLATVKDPRFDVATAALFDPQAPVTAGVVGKTLPAPTGISVHVDAYAPGHVVMTLDRPAPAGAALVAAENYYPGWHATADGRAAPIGRAQYSLIGVALPAGTRKVTLDFTSAPYETGKVVTWIAILASLIALIGGAVLERRRRG